MKCPSEVELNEFAEDRLESRRRWEIQEHLEQCTRCSGDLEGLDWITGCLGVIDTADESAEVEHPADADLAALAEGRVAPDLKAELLSHLSVCAECARVFGSLPRKTGKLTLTRSFYSFAAAAVLMIAIGVFAFTGQFARMGQGAPTMVASEPADAKRAESEPAEATEAPSLPSPAPTVVAQHPVPEATPEPEAVAGVSKPGRVALTGTPRHGRANSRHSAYTRRTRTNSLNNTQIAMGETHPTPEAVSDMPRAAAPKSITGVHGFDITKATHPLPAPPSAGASAAAVGAPGASGVAATGPTPSAPATGAAQQRSQTKSQMIQQGVPPPTAAKKKSAAKSAAKSIVDDEGEPKQELAKSGSAESNAGKSKVKSSDAGNQDGDGSAQNNAAGTGNSHSLAAHGPTDIGQSPPGNSDA